MSSESKVPEDAPAAAATGGAGVAAATPPSIDVVVVHPLVLLSVTDHYHRVAKDTRKRVVGVLLGEVYKGRGELRTGGGRGDVAASRMGSGAAAVSGCAPPTVSQSATRRC